jgi:LPXTG-motif cell wall-anchored protein
MRVLKAVCCAAALTVALAPGARADEWNKKTFLTFSGPVQVPGATLPAGTYTFKLADLTGNRHVVQIFDKEEKKIYTTLMAIPNQRLEPSDKPVVLFTETPAGSPQAIKVWYYPGETIGNEFVYPRRQAIAIAKATHGTVLSTTEESSNSEQMKNAEIGHIDEQGRMRGDDFPASTTASATTSSSRDAQLKNSGSTAPSTTAGTSGQATNAPRATTARAQADTTPRANTTGRRSLPRTGSNLPLFGLISALSLAAGLGLRRSRRADAA